MSQPTVIDSTSQFRDVVNKSTYVFIDFKADWCGPCKMISPIYNQLSSQYSSSDMAFTTIDVDAQQQLAREYGITAMPTFLLLKDGKVIETVRGANPPALKNLVERTARDAAVARERKAAEEKRKAEEAAKKDEPNDISVSGSYGITKGSGWKMSLR